MNRLNNNDYRSLNESIQIMNGCSDCEKRRRLMEQNAPSPFPSPNPNPPTGPGPATPPRPKPGTGPIPAPTSSLKKIGKTPRDFGDPEEFTCPPGWTCECQSENPDGSCNTWGMFMQVGRYPEPEDVDFTEQDLDVLPEYACNEGECMLPEDFFGACHAEGASTCFACGINGAPGNGCHQFYLNPITGLYQWTVDWL